LGLHSKIHVCTYVHNCSDESDKDNPFSEDGYEFNVVIYSDDHEMGKVRNAYYMIGIDVVNYLRKNPEVLYSNWKQQSNIKDTNDIKEILSRDFCVFRHGLTKFDHGHFIIRFAKPFPIQVPLTRKYDPKLSFPQRDTKTLHVTGSLAPLCSDLIDRIRILYFTSKYDDEPKLGDLTRFSFYGSLVHKYKVSYPKLGNVSGTEEKELIGDMLVVMSMISRMKRLPRNIYRSIGANTPKVNNYIRDNLIEIVYALRSENSNMIQWLTENMMDLSPIDLNYPKIPVFLHSLFSKDECFES
jgi:hypothetical protein